MNEKKNAVLDLSFEFALESTSKFRSLLACRKHGSLGVEGSPNTECLYPYGLRNRQPFTEFYIRQPFTAFILVDRNKGSTNVTNMHK
jgi:hypothetical protein